MMVEWELVSYCNYNCFYCKLPKIKTETNIMRIDDFIENRLSDYRDIILFCFGGEPFLHPQLNHIVKKLHECNQRFKFQTNLSNESVEGIKNTNQQIDIGISVHPTEVDIDSITSNIMEIEKMDNINIKNIDVMFASNKSLEYYREIKRLVLFKDITLVPVSGFYETESDKWIKRYNKLRDKYKKYKIYQFDDSIFNGEYRTDIWEKQITGGVVTKGKPCMYKDKYILFDSMLNEYNCCYRMNIKDNCVNSRCFFM